jgi:hypothetical protein
MDRGRGSNYTLFHAKPFGVPFGLYGWKRRGASGLIARLGPLGHVQVQQYRCRLVGKKKDGRRGQHGVKLSVWGVSGRRRKRSIELSVHL